jgi:hypothetical protein
MYFLFAPSECLTHGSFLLLFCPPPSLRFRVFVWVFGDPPASPWDVGHKEADETTAAANATNNPPEIKKYEAKTASLEDM